MEETHYVIQLRFISSRPLTIKESEIILVEISESMKSAAKSQRMNIGIIGSVNLFESETIPND